MCGRGVGDDDGGLAVGVVEVVVKGGARGGVGELDRLGDFEVHLVMGTSSWSCGKLFSSNRGLLRLWMFEREGRGHWSRRKSRKKEWKEEEAMIGLEIMVKQASDELVCVVRTMESIVTYKCMGSFIDMELF